MPQEQVLRKLAAILSADVRGYSRLMREDEVATIRRLNAYRDVINAHVERHHGRVVDAPGDNILAEFASVVDGVQAAVAVQRDLRARNAKLPAKQRMEFRIGLNLGDIIVEDERIYGDGVNIAARLEAMAEPGGICISRTAYDQIEDKLPFGYVYLGERTVKNIPRPIHAYRVIVEPDDLTARLKKWTRGRTGRIKRSLEGEAETSQSPMRRDGVSEKKRLLAVIFSLVFGVFGAHRFYAGRVRSGKMMLCTIGGFGIWYIIDNVIVLFGELEDGEGRKIKDWI